MRALRTLALAGAVILAVTLSTAQSYKGKLTIEDVMSAQELKDTGIAGLTASQRAALDVWLSRYTQTVIKLSGAAKSSPEPKTSAPPPTGPSCKIYSNTGEKESITSNTDGEVLILDDGSMWKVMDIDTVDSSLWLVVDDVLIMRADHPIACYAYTIINTDERGEKVQAQYLGQQ